MGFIDDRILCGKTRAWVGRGGVVHDDTFRGPQAGVDLPQGATAMDRATSAEAGRVPASEGDLRGHQVVADLEGIGIEQHLVGVESVPVIVHIRDEAGCGSVPCPSPVERPVRPPTPEAIQRPWFGMTEFGAPHPIIAASHCEVSRRQMAGRCGINLQHDAGCRWRMHRKSRRLFERAEERAE